MRRSFACRIYLGLALSTVLAACGGAAAPSGSAVGPAAAPSSAVTAAPASAVVARPSPGATPQLGAKAGAPIKIGLVESLTGPLANLGIDNRDGFKLYLDSINNSIAGHPLETIVADDQNAPDVGLTKTKQLVESDKVAVLMGMQGTPTCYAGVEYAKQAQVPVIVSGNCGALNLTVDAKYNGLTTFRSTFTTGEWAAVSADWSFKKGYRKVVLLTADYGAGLEAADMFGRVYVGLGGAIVQEIHPPLSATDFGPYIAQLTQDADAIATFLPGTAALRFFDQYASYSAHPKVQLIDMSAVLAGPNAAQLQSKIAGVAAVFVYSEAIDSPLNQSFVKSFRDKYPGRPLSNDVALGYTGAQMLVSALKKVNGDLAQRQPFLDALAATDVETARGPLKLDKFHDVVQNMYVYQYDSSGVGQKILDTYKDVSQFWTFTPEQAQQFPYGKLKGKWVGMTKAQLSQIKA